MLTGLSGREGTTIGAVPTPAWAGPLDNTLTVQWGGADLGYYAPRTAQIWSYNLVRLRGHTTALIQKVRGIRQRKNP